MKSRPHAVGLDQRGYEAQVLLRLPLRRREPDHLDVADAAGEPQHHAAHEEGLAQPDRSVEHGLAVLHPKAHPRDLHGVEDDLGAAVQDKVDLGADPDVYTTRKLKLYDEAGAELADTTAVADFVIELTIIGS